MYLITGITGQDGLFLTKNILNKEPKAQIVGISRDSNLNGYYTNLKYLTGESFFENINIEKINLLDNKETSEFISKINPKKIFNLSGPSSVYESLDESKKSYEIITNIFHNLTSACINLNNLPSFFQASSSEMFNQKDNEYLDESSIFEPSSPYAKAKYKIHRDINKFRDQLDWNISSGIMFNHESEFRNNDYLFMKIINGAIEIKEGTNNKITLGSLEIVRDWSYAEDFAEAMFRIISSEEGDDYVIGSGFGKSIKDLVENVFSYFDLDPELYINIDKNLLRPGDPKKIVSNPKKILNKLSWKTETSFETLIQKCIEYKLRLKD
tara:strand:+ start:1455 stop:2429 length:975 start_codon:yes stop_codon:yes gene_type:complete